MNVVKAFEIEITAPAKDTAFLAETGKFLGFTTTRHDNDVIFTVHGVPGIEYTPKEILEQITPPKDMDFTGIPNTFLLYLAFVRRQVQDMDMNTSGAQRYFANNGNGYEVSTHFMLGQETPKKPRIDGIVTGCYWNVSIGLKFKTTGKMTMYQDAVFCIKPESAVHEALDRMLRKNPEILDCFEIVVPIEVSKNTVEFPREFGYTIVP